MSGLRMRNLCEDGDEVFQEAGVGPKRLEDTDSKYFETLG